MSYSIFYDFETSDLLYVGQIVNYAFIVIDSEFNEIDKLVGDVKLSPLCLPRMGSIKTTKIDVLKHQEEATQTETQASNLIYSFLKKYTFHKGKTSKLIGYNSANFDLPYLRTTLIRNGFNPYFGLINKDLIHVFKKLRAHNIDFDTACHEYAKKSQWEKANNKLEFYLKMFNILKGEQSHESEDDVRWTIKLAKTALDKYNIDVRNHSSYEVKELESTPGTLYTFRKSKTEENQENNYINLAFHSSNSKNICWWINADLAIELDSSNQDLIGAIKYVNRESSIFYDDYEICPDTSLNRVVSKVRETYPKINFSDVFEKTDCDIEADIYRISFNRFDTINKKMNEPSDLNSLSQDEKNLVLRYRLKNSENTDNPRYIKAFKEYVSYRYSGKMLINKHSRDVHPSFSQMKDEIHTFLESNSDQNLKNIALNLLKYYQNSKVALALNSI